MLPRKRRADAQYRALRKQIKDGVRLIRKEIAVTSTALNDRLADEHERREREHDQIRDLITYRRPPAA